MRNTSKSLIPASQFLTMLADGTFRRSMRDNTITVKGDIHIDGRTMDLTANESYTQASERKNQYLRLEHFIFMGRVVIEHCSDVLFSASESHFMNGLELQYCSGKTANVNGCELSSFGGFKNEFDSLTLRALTGLEADRPEWTKKPQINISGFILREMLALEMVEAESLVLAGNVGRFSAPEAETDNPVFAMQLRLAGTKVYVSTEVAAKMIQPCSIGAELGALPVRAVASA